MQITLNIEDKMFLEAFEKLLHQFKISYQTTEPPLTQKEKRIAFLKKYQPIGAKKGYTPNKQEWYEQ